MPNWCFNTVTVSGKNDAIEKMKEEVAGEDTAFSLAAVVPIPKDVDWYEWSINNWGTKWDVEAEVVYSHTQSGHTILTWQFCSAWAPPTAVYAALAGKYPVQVTASWSEEGAAFWGGGTWRQEWVSEVETPGPHPATLSPTPIGWVLDNSGDVTVYPTLTDAVAAHEGELKAYQPSIIIFDEMGAGTVREPDIELYRAAIEGADGDEFVTSVCEDVVDHYYFPCAALVDAAQAPNRPHPERYATLRYYIQRVEEGDFNSPTLHVDAVKDTLAKLIENGTDVATAVNILSKVKTDNFDLAHQVPTLLT